MPVLPTQIGPVYDILISTRDGSLLSCAGRPPQRTAVNVSQVAYMCSTQVEQGQHEATELQRMTNLITQASQQETDRTFDAWPQVDQGDWSDGMLQRVFSGGQNKPTRYWDGLGVIWPITDYLPQQAVLATPDQAEAGNRMRFAGQGVTAGQITLTNTLPSYAYAYMQNNAPQHNILAIQTPAALRKIDPIPDSTNGVPMLGGNPNGSCDYFFGGSFLWVVSCPGGSPVTVHINGYIDGAPPVVGAAGTIPNASLATTQTVRGAWGRAGGKSYMAVLYYPSTTFSPWVRVFDLSASLFGAFVDVQLSDVVGGVGAVQVDFQGDNLIVGMFSGQQVLLTQFNIPTQSVSTLASFPNNANNIYFCPIAGGLFILVANEVAVNGFADTVDMYLLFGGQLQHIGPVTVQATTQGVSNVISGVGEPVAYGPYAIFPIYYFPVGSSTGTHVAVYAYDVLRGRLFKLQDIGGYDQFLGNQRGRRTAVASPASRPTALGTLATQWMVGVPVLSGSASASDVNNVQNLMVGVSNGSFQPFLQQSCQITSSLIDYTSSQNKLYRQAVASFTPLPNDAAITVKLDVWLDQDPAALAAAPDFTATLAGGGSGTGVKQLKLLINSVARKLVYRITTTGPSSTSQGAVKLISIAVQLSTGWNLHYFLDLASSSRTNGGNTFAYQEQGLDELQAYNFLRQLWRLKGGECRVTLTNGDSYNAILQLVEGASVKPFGVSSQGREPSFQQVVEVRLREDV